MYEMWKRQQVHEEVREMRSAEVFVNFFGKLRKPHLGGHNMVRRMDRQGEVLIW